MHGEVPTPKGTSLMTSLPENWSSAHSNGDVNAGCGFLGNCSKPKIVGAFILDQSGLEPPTQPTYSPPSVPVPSSTPPPAPRPTPLIRALNPATATATATASPTASAAESVIPLPTLAPTLVPAPRTATSIPTLAPWAEPAPELDETPASTSATSDCWPLSVAFDCFFPGRRKIHTCFMVPGPPNFRILRQFLHVPQSEGV